MDVREKLSTAILEASELKGNALADVLATQVDPGDLIEALRRNGFRSVGPLDVPGVDPVTGNAVSCICTRCCSNRTLARR